MKGFFRFVALVVFLGIAWVAIALLVGRDKESEQRLVGALSFVQETIQRSYYESFDLDVYHSPSIERGSQPNVWSISATLAIPDSTGTAIHEQYTAVVENLCQAYAEHRCWRLVQLTIGDAVLGNQEGLIRAALERIAPSVTPHTITTSLGTDRTGAQPSKDRTSEAPTAGMFQAMETTRISASEAPATLAAGDITVQSTDGARTQPDRSLVVMIQSQLRDRGLDLGPLDGVMGPRTRAAIATYQRRHGLTPDGIPSRSLLNSLRRKPRGQDEIDPVSTRPLPAEASAVTPSGRDQGAATDTQVALGAASARFSVALSAFGSTEITMRERNKLQEAFSDLLGETDLTIERINLGERGVFYQVLANHFPDRLTANYMCARVRARKRYCRVVTTWRTNTP